MIGQFSRPDGIFIGGRWMAPANDGRLPITDPSTGATVGDVARGTAQDAAVAINAARVAFDDGPWPHMAPAERGRILHTLGDTVESQADHFASVCVTEAGSPCSTSLEAQVLSAMPHYRDMVERGTRGADESLPTDVTTATAEFVVREPRGVVGAMQPWNSPFSQLMRQIGPALIMGNTLVLKPAPATPTCALDVAQLGIEAGIPAGVLNVVPGDVDVGRVLTEDPRVDMISFVGSSTTGRVISQAAGATLKRLLLELGGKSALVALPDADIDAIIYLGHAITWYAGQGCGLLTRFIIPEGMYDEVVARIAERLAAVRVGSAHDEATEMGPLISDHQRTRVESYIRSGIEESARLVVGGGRPEGLGNGYYVDPTLFCDVDPRSRIAQEEIFGPVLSVIRYDGEPDTGVRIANDSSYGLTAAVFTADRPLGLRMARAIRAGRVHVNNWVFTERGPFGGFKSSGIGRTWGRFGIEEYSEVKDVCWR